MANLMAALQKTMLVLESARPDVPAVPQVATVPVLEQDATIQENLVERVAADAADDLETIQEEVNMEVEFPSMELPEEEQYDNLGDDEDDNQAAHELLDAVHSDDLLVDNNSSPPPKTRQQNNSEKIKINGHTNDDWPSF